MAEYFKKHWQKYAGASLGLLAGIIALTWGFFRAVFLILTSLAGLLIVAYCQNDEKVLLKVKKFFAPIAIFFSKLWKTIFQRRRY